jgi:DNA invertase Pin-like site-specific DNA recombinase
MEYNKFYVYRHIRLDKNEVFYIGLGQNKRAWCKDGRNNYWKNIVKKSSYEIEVILDNLTREQAIQKEKEFIKLYGRKDLGLGTLCNKTDGGDGVVNRVGIKIHNKGDDKWQHLRDDIIKDIIFGMSDNEISKKYNTNKGVPYRYRKKYIKDKSIINPKVKKEKIKVKKEKMKKIAPHKGYEKWSHIKDDIINDIINGISESQLKSKYGISSGAIHRFKTKYITDKSIIKEKPKKPSKYDHLVSDIIDDFKKGFKYSYIMEKYNITDGSLYRLKKKYIK